MIDDPGKTEHHPGDGCGGGGSDGDDAGGDGGGGDGVGYYTSDGQHQVFELLHKGQRRLSDTVSTLGAPLLTKSRTDLACFRKQPQTRPTTY